jgi:hypothetical protein
VSGRASVPQALHVWLTFGVRIDLWL